MDCGMIAGILWNRSRINPMYLLNTQLNFQLPYIFMWLFHFLYLLHIAICLKYMIKGLIRDLFHRIPAIIPQSISALDCVSGWYQMMKAFWNVEHIKSDSLVSFFLINENGDEGITISSDVTRVQGLQMYF
jgi:hypothetical protein